ILDVPRGDSYLFRRASRASGSGSQCPIAPPPDSRCRLLAESFFDICRLHRRHYGVLCFEEIIPVSANEAKAEAPYIWRRTGRLNGAGAMSICNATPARTELTA